MLLLIYLLISLCLTLFLTFFRFMFIIRYKKKNLSLFKSISNIDFKNLVYIHLFIDKLYYPNYLKHIGIEKRDMYSKGFLEIIIASFVPIIQFFMFAIVFCFIFRLLFMNKDLSELYAQVDKNTDTAEAMIDSIIQVNLFKKYLNSNKYTNAIICNTISTVYNKSHPYKQLINDNFNKLLKLIEKKETQLKSTISECKKTIIEKDIESMIVNFIDLTNTINENLIEKEITDLSTKYTELINMLKLLKENITDVLSEYEKEESSLVEIEKEIAILSKYIENKDKVILKKILSDTETTYYKPASNLLNSILTCVCNLELKLEYVSSDVKAKIRRKIEYTILEYINVITMLDELIIPPNDKDVLEYNNLLEEVISDVKNKKGIFL